MNETLQLDNDQARALHRVVRAMHDGECPKCHSIHPSDDMRGHRDGLMWRCPTCGFHIYKEEANEILAQFGAFMDRSREIFEQWRENRARNERIRDSVELDVFLKRIPAGGART